MASYLGNDWSDVSDEERGEDAGDTEDSEQNTRDDREELEFALYSQIHYEANETGPELSLNGSLYHSDVSMVEKDIEKPEDYKPKPVPTSSKKSKNRKKVENPTKFVSVTYEIDTKGNKKEAKKSKDPVQYVIDTKGRTDTVAVVSDSEDSVIVVVPPQKCPSPVVILDDSDHWTFSDSKDTSDTDDSLSMEVGLAKAKPKKSLDLQFNFRKPAGFDHLETLLDSLGGNEDDWKIGQADLRGYSTPRKVTMKRYYGTVNVQCHNCKERGHLSKDCMQPKIVPKCTMCGSESHYGHCTNTVCFSCLRLGHTQFKCMDLKYPCHSRCSRCHRFGHVREDCSDWWRQFHVTTKPEEEIVRGTSSRNKHRCCAYCGRHGHFVEDCKGPRHSPKVNRLPLFSPHVMKYDTLKQYETQVQEMIGNLSLDSPKAKKPEGRKHERSYSVGRGTEKSTAWNNHSQEPKRRSNGYQARHSAFAQNAFEFKGWQDSADEKPKGKKRKKKVKGGTLFVSAESLVKAPKRKKVKGGTLFVSSESLVEAPKRKKGIGKEQSRVRRHSLRLEEAGGKQKTPS